MGWTGQDISRGVCWDHLTPQKLSLGAPKMAFFCPRKEEEKIGPEMLIWPKAVPAASNRLNKATNGLKMTAHMQSGTLGYLYPA